MIIDTFANRLQLAMQYNNMKQVDLVEKTNLDKSLISNYLSGKYKAKQDKLYLLAEALHVSEAWLMGYDVPMDKNIKIDELGNPVVSLPLVGTVQAGYDYLAQQNWIGTVDVSENIARAEEYFALKVKGDSMSPVFLEDDIVIIKKQNDCENNEYAIVLVNGDEGTLKKIKKTDAGIVLQPLNPAYEPIMYTYDEITSIPIVIIGIVKHLQRNF